MNRASNDAALEASSERGILTRDDPGSASYRGLSAVASSLVGLVGGSMSYLAGAGAGWSIGLAASLCLAAWAGLRLYQRSWARQAAVILRDADLVLLPDRGPAKVLSLTEPGVAALLAGDASGLRHDAGDDQAALATVVARIGSRSPRSEAFRELVRERQRAGLLDSGRRRP